MHRLDEDEEAIIVGFLAAIIDMSDVAEANGGAYSMVGTTKMQQMQRAIQNNRAQIVSLLKLNFEESA